MFDNPMRVSGLASGMDIDQMVDKLMKAERMPLDKMKQQQKTLEWRRDDYREMNKLLKELDQNIFDGVYRESTFLKKGVASTNESAVSAVASGLGSNVTTRISVGQLAKAATGSSRSGISAAPTDKIDPNATFADQAGKFNVAVSLGTEFTLKVFQPDGDIKTQSFKVDPETDSLQSVLRRINDSDLGVSAFYDQNTDKISIATNHTGYNENGAEIAVEETSGNFFTEVLQFASTDVANNGQNAKFTLNGLETERTSNSFSINHITYTLKQKTSTDVTITTATDTDTIYDSIQSFVDKYNETIEKINDKLSEELHRDYPPLTDKQRDGLSEHEIKLWEEKAQSGMLRSDSFLSGGLGAMRLDLYSEIKGANVDQALNQLSEIGIVTSSNYREHGKLVIQDPSKLRQAIDADPEKVAQLFNKDGNSFETKGIAQRVRDTIAGTMEKIEHKAGNTFDTEENYSIGKKLKSNENQIDDFKRRLEQIESRYYRQFTAMEQAIQRANQQSTFLTNQFSNGQ